MSTSSIKRHLLTTKSFNEAHVTFGSDMVHRAHRDHLLVESSPDSEDFPDAAEVPDAVEVRSNSTIDEELALVTSHVTVALSKVAFLSPDHSEMPQSLERVISSYLLLQHYEEKKNLCNWTTMELFIVGCCLTHLTTNAMTKCAEIALCNVVHEASELFKRKKIEAHEKGSAQLITFLW